MAKHRIAILEDDATLAAAMKQAFDRQGIDAFFSSRTDEIVEYLQKYPVSVLFVDCLLPSGSGVEFVEQLRKNFPASVLDIVMMSGIFTDTAFVKDTIRSTQAAGFLKKPFELSEALACVKENNGLPDGAGEISPRKELYLLFNRSKVTVREKRKAIEALDEIHGFDLPYLYSLMVETQATGHLNIAGSKGEVSGISFSDGKIVAVDIVDQETQLGKLLIEAGYILPDDLKEALSETSSKRLGERLIHGNLLSPHAFNIALANQMSIRLSRTIVDAPVRVNFVGTDVPLTYPYIDSDALSVFLHDWIASKISFKWLKAHYVQWDDYTLTKSASYSDQNPVLHMPLIEHFAGIVDYFAKGISLHQLMDSKKFPEDTAYKALHLLLAKGLLVFNDKVVVQPAGERAKAIKKLLIQFQGKNKLETWDFMVRLTGSRDSDPLAIYSDFQKILGPEPVPDPKDPASKEIMKAYLQVKALTDEAYQFSRTGNREKMKEEIAKSEIESKIKAANYFEEAKAALHKSQFSMAVPLLAKAVALEPGIEKIKTYQIWAKLGQGEAQNLKVKMLRDVEMELMQVPPEEKFDALFSFVMGLYQKAKGDFPAAKKQFEKAANLDVNFIAPRRELALMHSAKPKDVFNRDLKDFVAGFFKKR